MINSAIGPLAFSVNRFSWPQPIELGEKRASNGLEKVPQRSTPPIMVPADPDRGTKLDIQV